MEELADLIGPELGKFASCGIQINAEHMLSHWLLQFLSQYVDCIEHLCTFIKIRFSKEMYDSRRTYHGRRTNQIITLFFY